MKLRKIAAIGAATAVLVGIVAGPASADPTDVTVSGGTLSMTAFTAGNFAGITLNGATQTDTATVDNFSVTDATGSGSGWKLTAQGTQFREYNATDPDGTGPLTAGYVSDANNGRTIPASSLNLGVLTATANGTTSAAPTMTAATAIDGSGAIKFASAAVGAGMGKYDISNGTNRLSLSISPSTYAKTYRSDLTVTLASTP